ncbi:hypothetical protein UY3_14363 [Chelonia mydas]|uniref:Uncharacterized protein n=1 Tax=Chelonia mydas TaxID=8469 RepID=M7BJZ2_CHEMY|nr:hypothetical protein UY3_14363 [Chelonia mydas]
MQWGVPLKDQQREQPAAHTAALFRHEPRTPTPIVSPWTPPLTAACTVHTASSQLTRPAFCTRNTPTWCTPELLDLLGLGEEEAVQSQLCSSHRNLDTYGQIARGMQEKGHERETQQYCAKIKELSPMDTLRGLEAGASRLNPKDTVADKEVELEDDV